MVTMPTAEHLLDMNTEGEKLVKKQKVQAMATISLGKGSIASSLQKQGLNTRSYTESKVVAMDNKLPQILWTKYFLDKKG